MTSSLTAPKAPVPFVFSTSKISQSSIQSSFLFEGYQLFSDPATALVSSHSKPSKLRRYLGVRSSDQKIGKAHLAGLSSFPIIDSTNISNDHIKMPLTEFHRFPLLPPELRDKIWQETVIPRVLVIKYDHDRGFFSITPPPTAFRVSTESRAAVLESYHLSFGSATWEPPRTYVNFSIDTVYLPEDLHKYIPMFFSLLTPEEVSRFRYLAIDDDLALRYVSVYDYGGYLVRKLEAALACFPNLARLISVQNVERFLNADGNWYLDEDGGEIEGPKWHWEKVHSHIPPTMHLFFKTPSQLLDETVKIKDDMEDVPDARMWRFIAEYWDKVSHLVVPALAWQSNAELVSDTDGRGPIKAFAS